MLHAIVHPADIQDRDGGILVMATLFGMFPFLKTLFADGGYQGPQFSKAVAKVLPHLDVEIVKRSDRVGGPYRNIRIVPRMPTPTITPIIRASTIPMIATAFLSAIPPICSRSREAARAGFL
jgi:hypothetical protein